MGKGKRDKELVRSPATEPSIESAALGPPPNGQFVAVIGAIKENGASYVQARVLVRADP